MFMTGQNRFHVAHSDAQANLRFALARLSTDWRQLEPLPLEILLRHLLMAEHRCMPHPSVLRERPTNRWLLPRLRRRRIEVAERLVALGGRVSHAALARVLPRGRDWPGISSLVGRHAWDPVEGRTPRSRLAVVDDPAPTRSPVAARPAELRAA
ncbi:hypothetical protein [Mitsuaria sp. GD03876]|uniref:hypothetical protein n=1 Tax=Mitsuaria sp. GD03876 TaxID=2975399 RepID=UPI00244996CA|nr:hypothetical protein [Mitsuaria sp. GD03876]MDH0865476.1 hypothetical protein [Mitsuaria sp. GD03876]